MISKRHHYLPEFFLKGFVGDDGKLACYDLREKKFKSRPMSPRQVFFEWDRNTFTIQGEKTDSIESLYKRIDSDIGKAYNRIKENVQLTNIDPMDLMHLITFVGMTYWRTPHTDTPIKQHVKSSSNEDLHFKIVDSNGAEIGSQEMYQRVMNEPFFVEGYRMMKPIFEYIEAFSSFPTKIENWKIYYPADPIQLHVIADNPVILRSENGANIFEEELVFPLTKGKFLYHTKKEPPSMIQPETRVKIDMLLTLQSERFVCGPNAEYLKMVIKLASQYEDTEQIEFLRQEIFNELQK